MSNTYTTLLGKAVRYLARLRGGGSALPGLFVEKIDPGFIKRTLSQLPQGVIVISGTNGKTTTTKMAVELLESQGLKVFTNRTGSNFTRGVAAALLAEVNNKGQLNADIAVLELDEAHAVHFIKTIKPRYSLLLNVMRDQLDRFGEIDTTAKMLHSIAQATTDGVIINRDDPRLSTPAFAVGISAPIHYFGVHPTLKKLFPSDDELHGSDPATAKTQSASSEVSLDAIAGQTATIAIESKSYELNLKIKGVYNILNAVAAITLCREVVGEAWDTESMTKTLEDMNPAFGRGEVIMIGNQPLELVLVKNPSGFRLSLASFDPQGYRTMIAINDNYADGRDMSWLWDVDFSSLQETGVAEVSGIRAYDMALRLQYDEITMSHVSPDLSNALRHFITEAADQPKRIYCTYTAMLALRQELAKITDVEAVL